MSTGFWEKWCKANELEKVELVETLTLPSPRLKGKDYKYHCASLINSYLVDLVEYLEKSSAKAK